MYADACGDVCVDVRAGTHAIIAVASKGMGAAHLLFLAAVACFDYGSAAQAAVLVVGSGCAGLAFGATWPHLVVLASELFGSRHLAPNYLFFDGGCGAIGTIFLANLLPSAFYRVTTVAPSAVSQLRDSTGAPTAEGTCLGWRCFGISHIVITALCFAAALAAGVISTRARALYSNFSRDSNNRS